MKWKKAAILAGIASMTLVGCGGDGDSPSRGGSGGGSGSGMGVEQPPEVKERGIVPVNVAEIEATGGGDPAMAGPGAPPPDGLAAPAADPKKQNDLKQFAYDRTGQEINIKDALQQAADQYNRVRPSSAPAPGLTMWPELTNINYLVKVGLVRRIPPAPPGKTWAMEGGQKVVLVDAP